MMILGITGGIGSGKSVVVSLLQSLGIPTYIADDEAKRLTNSSPVIRDSLIAHFGQDIFVNNVLNKQKLASLIFGNTTHLKLVNSIIHPVVEDDFMHWSESHGKCNCVAIEAAILFESGFDRFIDVIWSVYAPLEVRIRRIMQRKNADYASVMQRINNQLPDEEKCRLADDIIYNDDTEPVLPQVEFLLKKYTIEIL